MVKLPTLREIRERHPMTQEELAARASINRVTLANIERGDSEPRPETIRRLADALGVSAQELMGDPDEVVVIRDDTGEQLVWEPEERQFLRVKLNGVWWTVKSAQPESIFTEQGIGRRVTLRVLPEQSAK